MKSKNIYLLLCIAGILIPWFFLVGFLGERGASVPVFFTSIFANNVASAVAGDLIVSALGFFVFVYIEGKRSGMKNLWVYVIATLLVGLSFGLPLFLFKRACMDERNKTVNYES